MSYFNFFDETNPEYDIYNDNTKEFIEQFGIPVKYLPRTLVNHDDLFGEDGLSAFNDAYECKMYLEDSTAFGGNRDLFSKFGLEVDDSVTLKIQQDYIKELINDVPQVGDIIKFEFNDSLFEITHVEDEEIFYLMGKQTTYTLSAKRWEYSGEELNTGDEEIDSLEDLTNSMTVDDGNQEFNEVMDFSETNPFGDF